MSRYLARILRAIIVAVLGVGGGAGLLIFIAMVVLRSDQFSAIDVALQTALVIGLSFGCFIATVLLLTDLTMRLFVSQGKYEEIWELNQTRVLELEGSLREVRRLCREALLVVPNIKSVSEEEDSPNLMASTGASWRSPGERLQISIESAGDNKWKIRCNSQCAQQNIAFDYAKNYENVESFLKRMSVLSKG
ncbi:MAG: hypothetical protein K2X77_04590 [Candidatus Obscuribacterales bacterium]|jgi:hypothetical protein|nr:hypothetical protein [Candidatus Obscuribacterales bacterium]